MTQTNVPIAVVGVSTLFPGSSDATGFYRDILSGVDRITDVPPSHWLVEDYYDPDPTAPDKTYANRGAFVPAVPFDPMHWGVPPSTVQATDTCQLLALIVAQRVLDDAARGQFKYVDRERISVILGVTSAQELLGQMNSRLQRPVWVKSLREMGLPEDEVQKACDRIASHYPEWQEATFPGVLGNVVAGRIANKLDLGGTNCVTDAACASTFSALSMAVNELRQGGSDVVICGGADTMNDIFMYLCFSKTPALSKSGDCRPFSDQADGTMLGEGFGMVALKRLDEAERDGDRIYAVIRAVGTSSDGRGAAVYAPVSDGQAKAVRRAYATAGYGPDSVRLVEAHGTGTVAGDAAEFEGLRMVFDESGREDRQWCALGSVKSQIGHTKAAAGAAGLVKAVFALQHRVLPPTIKVDRPNPKLDLGASPFHLSTRARPWVRDPGHPRRASVSSFGFGGSNFHVALEEYDGPGTAAYRRRASETELFLVGAASAAELAGAARKMAQECSEEGMFAFLARDTQERYDATQPWRLSIVASDAADLQKKLARGAELADKGEPMVTPDGVALGTGAHDGAIGFVFPGQGSQYVDMGAAWAMAYEAALSAWDEAAALDDAFEEPLADVVFPRPVFTDAERDAQHEKLTATEWAQPAIGVTSLSALRLLDAIGVRAEAVCGHSFGEVSALCAAGVMSSTDAIRVARRRGEAMAEAAKKPGAMVAVAATIEDVRAKIAAWDLDVGVANHNGPMQVVLSGATDRIDEAKRRFEDEGVRAVKLPVSTAFHSPIVADGVAPFGAFLADVELSAPKVPVFANATATAYPADGAGVRALLTEQLTSAVRFVGCIDAMYAAGVRTFVEVGPGSVLSGLVGEILKGRPHHAIAMDRKGQDGLTSLHRALGRLAALGVPMELGALWEAFLPATDPRTVKAPKLVLPISGTNYDKPYPPKEGAAGLPAPNPPRTSQKAPAMSEPTRPTAPRPSNGAGPATPTAAATDPMASRAIPTAAPPAMPTPAMPTPAMPTAQPAMDPTASGAWASAYLEVQSRAIDAHTAYTQAMAQAHAAFLAVQERALATLPTMIGGAPAAYTMQQASLPAPAPVLAAPAATPFTMSAVPAQSAPAPTSSLTSSPVVTAPAPVAPTASAASAPRGTGASSAAALSELMLAVVAEKTGYPREMLELSMDLEADLGVDSIKRVEILAAMRERADALPEVDPAELGKLRTLQEIVDRLGDGAPPVAPSAPRAGIDLTGLMLEVVGQKTGYPIEMLELSMDLEADLGVDSIKRVEILAAVRERAADLPEVDTAELG
ncbi:MAG: beta-ketoacyl synthase N-terminal-like domain-containing protein [Sandaracinaceae bacterium]